MTRMRDKSESGAALVEFALLLPVFMALVLGMFSGGLIYNQKMDLTHASREGARYGAAIDKAQRFSNQQSWASNVRDLVVARSGGDLTAGSGTTAGISTDGVCVALVFGSTPTATDINHTTAGGTSACFTDSSSDTGTRVQVSARKAGKLEVLFFARVMTLTANATAHYEGTG